MLDKFLVLLERFVVAHELIAANSARETITQTAGDVSVTTTKPVKELPVEGEDVIDTKPKKIRAKAKPAPEPEEDLADHDEEPAPKKTRAKKGPDLGELRDEIKTMAKHIAAGDDDECADKFDDLLDAYKVRTVTKLDDEDVEAFHADAKALVAKYYEITED